MFGIDARAFAAEGLALVFTRECDQRWWLRFPYMYRIFPLLMTSVQYSQRSLTIALDCNYDCVYNCNCKELTCHVPFKRQPRHPTNQCQSVN